MCLVHHRDFRVVGKYGPKSLNREPSTRQLSCFFEGPYITSPTSQTPPLYGPGYTLRPSPPRGPWIRTRRPPIPLDKDRPRN